MKHLKKFEELNVETYIKAGEALRKSGHAQRGQIMIDFAKRGQLDDTPELNLWIKWMNTYQPGRGSEGVDKGIISETPIKAKVDMVHINLDTLSDDIDEHKADNSYPLNMTISFRIDESEISKIKPNYLKWFKGDTTLFGKFYKIWPMELFTSFSLDENGNIGKVNPVTFFTYGEIGAMFSDRKSANSFKSIIKKILNNEIKVYTGYKDEDDGHLMTNSEAMLSILSREISTIEISDIEEILDAFNNINTNSLYADDPNDALKRISN